VLRMRVPFFDYAAHFKEHEGEYVRIFREVMGRGAFILQREVEEFEQALAEFVGVKHAIAVADGTNAMLLGFRALDLPAGGEVIMCSHTYVATAAAAHYAGLRPVPVEVSADRTIDCDSVEEHISSRTCAIMPTQLNGRVADMDRLEHLCHRYDLVLVEDAAQALGARYKGKAAGTFGAFGTYSFYPAKALGCFGDGGALVTDDDVVAVKVRRMRDHGRDDEGRFVMWGTNCRLDNLQAAILTFKLSRYPEIINRRRMLARRYCDNLTDVNEIQLPPGPDEPNRFDIYQNFEIEAERRDQLRRYLATKGIGTLVQWNGQPLHRLSALGLSRDLPRTETFFQKCLMLPLYPGLTDDQVDFVCEAIHEFYRSH